MNVFALIVDLNGVPNIWGGAPNIFSKQNQCFWWKTLV